jgi:hypothetical protein
VLELSGDYTGFTAAAIVTENGPSVLTEFSAGGLHVSNLRGGLWVISADD